ncbi:tRNA nucleotidyltransferase [Chitinispirillum alkaliphilum]|nr:tRNA nucleotidyltransferase [Chitinispirillum alkaliphilum]
MCIWFSFRTISAESKTKPPYSNLTKNFQKKRFFLCMKNFSPDEQLQAAIHIIKTLVENGYEALFAGGWVRDYLMGNREPGDIDIATNATPESIAELFSHTLNVGEQFGVMVVIYRAIPFEVATFRCDVGISDGRHPQNVVFTDSKTDALRRDFTINGMFYDPFSEKVIDYVGGKEDIEKGVVRCIGNPDERFEEDYLRMLRAVRFAAEFDFSIEDQTYEGIERAASYIKKVSPERIFTELDKMLRGANPDLGMKILHQTGLLKETLPEVEDLVGVKQPPQFHPEGDVFSHTLKALHLLQPSPSSSLAWSVLLHDVGKPPTMSYQDRIRFNNHHHVGAVMSVGILKRLRVSNNLTENVKTMVENHMNFMNVRNMRLSTLKKFLTRPTLQEELELHRVDCLASHGDLSNYHFVKLRLSEFKKEQLKPDPLLSGKDLIGLGFRPGPLFGRILGKVYDLQLEETIKSKDQAIGYVEERYRDLKKE